MKRDRFNFHQIETKRIFVYLAIVFCVYYGLWLIAILLPDSAGNAIYSFLGFPVIFMGTPALSVFFTRKITCDKSAIAYNIKVWKSKKNALVAMFVPTVLVFVGAVLFYLIFPNDLDYSGNYIIQTLFIAASLQKNDYQTGSAINRSVMGNSSCTAYIFWNELWFGLCRRTVQRYCYDDIILHDNWYIYVFCNVKN